MTGISNGGMMCYRLAAELSDRIAAIAPVARTYGGGRDGESPLETIHPGAVPHPRGGTGTQFADGRAHALVRRHRLERVHA